MSLSNEEKKKLIELARLKQREKEERERLQKEFADEHFGVTEEEFKEIEEKAQREVDEEIQADEEAQRQKEEKENRPIPIDLTLKHVIEVKKPEPSEPQATNEKEPVFEWIRKKKEGDRQ